MGQIAKGIGGIFSSILGGGGKDNAPKPPKPPPVMPVPDDELIKQDQLRKLQAAQSTGRASTILTDSGDGSKLGG